MTARLPVPGSDDGMWGNILNSFLEVAHNSDGTLQSSALSQAGGITSNQVGSANGVAGLNSSSVVPTTQLGTGTASSSNFLRGDGTWAVPTIGNANTWTAAQTFNNGNLLLAGSTSGTTTLEASATASGVLTLPATTDTVVVTAAPQTLTNKRLTYRVVTLTVSANTYTIPADNCDLARISTAPTANFTIAAPSPSTPTDGQMLMLTILSGGTGFVPTWNPIFISSGIATLPTSALSANKTVTFGFQFSSAKSAWVLLAYDGTGY